MITLGSAALIGVFSLMAACLALVALSAFPGLTARDRTGDRHDLSDNDDDVVFLFDDRVLADATRRAKSLLPDRPTDIDDWGRFLAGFAHRFAGIESSIDALPEDGRVIIPEAENDPDSLTLVAERKGNLTRVTLSDPVIESRSELVERYSLTALRAELSTLRSIAEQAPTPTWKKRHDGTITWANGAYMALAREEVGDEALFGWPPPDVFSEVNTTVAGDRASRRIALPSNAQEKPRWFDLLILPGEVENLHFAMPVDNLIRAETALSDFVQTLTKTFAHLTIGLAIFDRQRQLALFNPALVDLTSLPAELLSQRPSLHAFLDALRERQRIPEPKDYKSWRLHIAQLEAAAADGTYEQVWHLPTGQTYRVTGRPHPDGAVAYVFEDISSEVSMTRSYRSEIELGQSIMDNLDDAIAVFTQSGTLSISNRAYADMWKFDPASCIGEVGVTDASSHWQELCQPSPVWARLRSFILDRGDRSGWSAPVVMRDATSLTCTVKPLVGGAAMVSFRREARPPLVAVANADAQPPKRLDA